MKQRRHTDESRRNIVRTLGAARGIFGGSPVDLLYLAEAILADIPTEALAGSPERSAIAASLGVIRERSAALAAAVED